MGDPRAAVIWAVEDLIEANLAVRSQLEQAEHLLRGALSHIESGATVGDTLRALQSVEERQANLEVVREFYARRRDVRNAVIDASLAEGMSVSDLAHVFGFPHETIASHGAERAADGLVLP